jgi:autotransporter strand-loop-strand O-heptosyltransferase
MRYTFVEIGTSDFDTLIQGASDEYGISIEPIKYYLDRLPEKKNVKKVQAAMSDKEGEISIYNIPDNAIKLHNLPWWVRGSNSVNQPHQFTINAIGKPLYDSVVNIDRVPTITWERLVKEYDVEGIDYLKIDTEGYDHVILQEYLKICNIFPNLLANKIKFEYFSPVSNIGELDKLIPLFKGYTVIKNEGDITLIKPSIPRIIHQTFKTNSLPGDVQTVVNRLKAMNPTFEYRFYDDGACIEFIKNTYDSDILNTYLSISPIYTSARADLFRYLLMYEIGGVYLDIKSCTTVPLEETLLPTDEYLLSHWPGRDWNEILSYFHGEFQNWHIICKPKHPFLKKVIETVINNIKNYNGELGKESVLKITGPIAYSKAILSILDIHRIYTKDSPVREYKLSEEIGLTYMQTLVHHNTLYSSGYDSGRKIIKHENAYVLYATPSYIPTVTECVRSLNIFSKFPVIVYLINSDEKIEGATTINWKCDVPEINNQASYIDRKDTNIYKLLIQRPLIVKDALINYANFICYVDADSIATTHVDNIFSYYPKESDIPYFTEGIYDFLLVDGKGGAETRKDLSTTLEAPACELFGVNQYIRQKYRQTGYFVAGQNTILFLDEWNTMCINPVVMKNHTLYAPYNEETLVNILLWKWGRFEGLPYIYINASFNEIENIYTKYEYGKTVREWFKLPNSEEELLFIHGEKSPEVMKKTTNYLQGLSKKLKVLFISSHLSTGGGPQFLLKRIKALQKYTNTEIFVVEHQCLSMDFVVQRNEIIKLVGKNFKTLYENKMELFDVILTFSPDIVHIDDMSERMDNNMIDKLYNNNRTYRIIETCHDISFVPSEKKFHPDGYAFCTPYHLETFAALPSLKTVIEFPIDREKITKGAKNKAKWDLGININTKHILNVGLWAEWKNQKEGIEIARKYPDMQFHFVGNQAGNFKDYWGPLMKDIPSNVTIWGERKDVDVFMKACDVFMFNSTWECNPIVIREAISYGLPIIGRNLPQYGNMFKKYLQPIDIGLSTIKRNYSIPIDNTLETFAANHIALYTKVKEREIIQHGPPNKINIIQHFVNNPFLEIKGESDSLFTIRFYDENSVCHYENTVRANNWVKLNRSWYTRWTAKVWENGSLIYENTLDYTGKRVFIAFDSESLGDNIAWMPYVLEFKKKHNCHVIVSTFKNFLFEKVYKELEFVSPGTTVHNLYGMYKIGWFYNTDMEPVLCNTIPLQQTATNILGLDYTEIIPRIDYVPKKRMYKYKYVTIASNSTAQLKFWTIEGWTKLAAYLLDKGYKVINVSKERNTIDGVQQITDVSIENTMHIIHHSEFLISLSSGLGWLGWGMGKPIVLIANFSHSSHEFQNNCIRITNETVCNSCWNNRNFKFDKNWEFCPIYRGTNRAYECQTSITAEMVIDKIKPLLSHQHHQ